MGKIVEKCSDPRTLCQIVASAVLRCGPMPKHVAFVMDGNRRYARKLGQPIIEGHEKGRRVLEEVIRWSLALKIPMITVYAFSIENFKRSPEEVENLLKLFEKMLQGLNASANQGLGKFGVRFQILGNWDKMPDRLKPVVAKIHYHALEHPESPLLVNLAIAYTSRDAIVRSHLSILDGRECVSPSDITVGFFQELHSLFPILPVDLFIRTGGDTRLSDFMLWESAYAHIEFLQLTWPEFTFWELWKAIFRYQATPRVQERGKYEKLTKPQLEFIAKNREKMWKEMELAAELYGDTDEGDVTIFQDNWFKRVFVAVIDF